MEFLHWKFYKAQKEGNEGEDGEDVVGRGRHPVRRLVTYARVLGREGDAVAFFAYSGSKHNKFGISTECSIFHPSPISERCALFHKINLVVC